jgi:hypothetical protein
VVALTIADLFVRFSFGLCYVKLFYKVRVSFDLGLYLSVHKDRPRIGDVGIGKANSVWRLFLVFFGVDHLHGAGIPEGRAIPLALLRGKTRHYQHTQKRDRSQ